jgi:hypothetical protein
MTQLSRPNAAEAGHFKDAILDRLAETANVAQFVSFGPGLALSLRYARVHDWEPAGPTSVGDAVQALLDRSPEHSVNVRSFLPDQPKSHDFVYGLRELDEVVATIRRLAERGLYTIVNETIDVNDGGVSGVSYAGVLEFAPGDTPRCVEKPGTAAFPYELGTSVLETVYGFRPDLDQVADVRVEFSIHPIRRGVRRAHTVVWEEEQVESIRLPVEITWPNRFSRFLGDKAFGLAVAHAASLRVPATTVVSRAVAPFAFGLPTGTGEHWIRTCPVEQVPGHFTTRRGWLDPFELIAAEDPDGDQISSVLAQEGVEAAFSGAAVAGADGALIVEGVAGSGEEFMQGRRPPQPLPSRVVEDVNDTYARGTEAFGAVRFEWVHDGAAVWVVQLHRGTTGSLGRTIYPGEAEFVHGFQVDEGLEALRSLIDRVEPGEGITLIGNVGVTSHLGDVLRRARIPSRIEPS